MDTKDFLADLVDTPGISGYEESISSKVSRVFERYCDEVRTDAFYNVYGKMTDKAVDGMPKVMLAAHIDEIGLMVKEVCEDGFLRFVSVGGVDQRILPGLEVIVRGKENLLGIIGAKPPHLQAADEAKKALEMKDMAIDVGICGDQLKELISVGDPITFKSPLITLNGTMICGKSLDDRAGAAILLETMKQLDELRFEAEVYLVATVQEELGTRGAIMSTFRVMPDIGIAIDVTHGDMPDAPKEETFAMDKGPVIAIGPNMHPGLTKKLMDIAKEYGIEYLVEVEAGPTGTDARAIQISRSGVPTVLVQIPLKYMHTTVETINIETVKKAGMLLARFISSMKEGWREWMSY
jgi:endoglucanase